MKFHPRKKIPTSSSSRGTGSSSTMSGIRKNDAKTILISFLCLIGIIYTFGYRMFLFSLSQTTTTPTLSSSQGVLPTKNKSLNSKHLKYITIVMPSVVNPNDRQHRLEAIDDTWGPSSNAIYVVQNATNEYPKASLSNTNTTSKIRIYSKNKRQLSFPMLMVVPPNMEGMQRYYSILRQIDIEFKNLDFVFFVNDHTFVLPEHLCHYLLDKNPQDDMYHGHLLKTNNFRPFNSGAAGYILSQRTLQRILQLWETTTTTRSQSEEKDTMKQQQIQDTCFFPPFPEEEEESTTTVINNVVEGEEEPGVTTFLKNNPGMVLAQCLQDILHIYPMDSRQENKYHRFHAYGLLRTIQGKFDDWYVQQHRDLVDEYQDPKKKQINGSKDQPQIDPSYRTLLSGPHCCSAESISFHFVEAKETLAFWEIHQHLRLHPEIQDRRLQELITKRWPKRQYEVGVSSYLLPHPVEDPSKHNQWKAILRVLRNLAIQRFESNC